MIILGARMFGKVDEVPGLFHVATRCAHIWYIPLLPMGGSMIMLEPVDKGGRGVPIPLDTKSMLTAWLRGFLIAGAFVALIMGVKQIVDKPQNVPLGIGLICLAPLLAVGAVMMWKMRSITHAKYERAVAIAQKVGFNEEGMVMIEMAFGRVSAAEGAEVLAQLRADAAKIAEIQQSMSPAPPTAPPVAPPTRR